MKQIYTDSEIRGPKLLNDIRTYRAIELACNFTSLRDWATLSCEEYEDGTVGVYYEFFDIRDAFRIEEIIETAQKMDE